VVEEDLHFPLQYWAALKNMSSSFITCKHDSYDFDKDLTLAREARLHGEYADLNEPFMELINWLMKRQKVCYYCIIFLLDLTIFCLLHLIRFSI